jgi:hypothetical protein
MAGAMLVALLILRSVFRRQGLAKLAFASALAALLPTAVVIGIGFNASRLEEASAHDLESRLFWVPPTFTWIAFPIAWLILRYLFPRESSAKAVFACVLIAQFACATPLLAAIVYPWLPTSDPWSLQIAEQTFFHLITFLPDLLLLVLWVTVIIRHSRGEDRGYEREAAIAVVIGLLVFAWTYPAVMWLNYAE